MGEEVKQQVWTKFNSTRLATVWFGILLITLVFVYYTNKMADIGETAVAVLSSAFLEYLGAVVVIISGYCGFRSLTDIKLGRNNDRS